MSSQNYNSLVSKKSLVVMALMLGSATAANIRNLNWDDPGCHKFTTDGSCCIKCSFRFYMRSNGRCAQVSDHCKTWDEETGKCTSCYLGYGNPVRGVCSTTPVVGGADSRKSRSKSSKKSKSKSSKSKSSRSKSKRSKSKDTKRSSSKKSKDTRRRSVSRRTGVAGSKRLWNHKEQGSRNLGIWVNVGSQRRNGSPDRRSKSRKDSKSKKSKDKKSMKRQDKRSRKSNDSKAKWNPKMKK